MEENLDKRAIFAIILSLIVLIGYQVFFLSHQKKQPIKKQQPINNKKEVHINVNKPIHIPIEKSKEEFITIDTPLYKAVLSSKGATIKQWKLKNYLDDNDNQIELTKKDSLIPPLAIGFDDEFKLKNLIFKVQQGKKAIKLDKKDSSASIVFYYNDNGISIKRIFTFYENDYRIEVKEEVIGIENYWIALGSGFGDSGIRDYKKDVGIVVLKDVNRKKFKFKDIKEPKLYKEGLKWVALEDKYFFSAIVPPKGAITKLWRNKEGEVIIGVKLSGDENSYLVYAGPKEHERLKSLGVGLEHIIDFGFFSILARPLFWILKFFYKIIGNYGWAIVIVTIITRIPFIPLINKGQKSMKKLQALQPKMNEIRRKYKKDPKKMQQEIINLYKRYKVNPISGCLPMLIQIPVFYALYKVLLNAIELRGAPFMLWIEDLSKKDPYYILPIIMGITMFIQQKITPSTGNPQQEKIMKYLPLVFTFLFLSFPSGLVLYWLVNNILSIIQQWYINSKVAID